MARQTSMQAREERLIHDARNFEHAFMFAKACELAEQANSAKDKLSHKKAYLQALANLFECEIEDLLD